MFLVSWYLIIELFINVDILPATQSLYLLDEHLQVPSTTFVLLRLQTMSSGNSFKDGAFKSVFADFVHRVEEPHLETERCPL